MECNLLKGLMNELTIVSYTFKVYSEDKASEIVQHFKDNQIVEGYILTKSNISYKAKKDRKTGEILEEIWTVVVTMNREVA